MTSAVVIEDDRLASMALSELLEGEGFSVRSFANADEAWEACQAAPPDLLIADWCVPGRVSSRELADEVKRLKSTAKVVFVSGYTSDELPADIPGSEYFSKPLNFDLFLRDIRAGRLVGGESATV